ncbi:uncharacterized protein MEPE_00685 [Melanopsichium pennsylvanicum]|uniref:Mitochondrial adapter protein MCP1 transmembrane domain-containing protein n=2 Tax=Melanopsichium pennsylvanicum TaxID=63383 RepID=A0AAJ4XGE0_9BASI|nr:conserved hypothetical protein [Melanopsichium pennsylvanicum 4]SNX81980.1 uncharacterized protein MEPE_00685 [Melanopsichium pennsylvanicum]
MTAHFIGLQLQDSAISIPTTYRRRTLSILARLQSASAAALVAFGVVHLSAPLVGLLQLGGDVNDRVDAVSGWMLLGRVAYQSGVGEAALWAALGAHLVAGITKRLVTCFTVARTSAESTISTELTDSAEAKEQATAAASTPPRASWKLSIAQKSGYVLAPFALHHALVNRIIPSSASPPISSLSPSELDYSFVSHTLSHPNVIVRLTMATAYTVLIGAFAVHTVYAVPVLLRCRPKRSSSARVGKGKRSQAQVSASLAIVLLTSLLAIVPVRSGDSLTISGALKSRYDAVLRVALPTRFFFYSP